MTLPTTSRAAATNRALYEREDRRELRQIERVRELAATLPPTWECCSCGQLETAFDALMLNETCNRQTVELKDCGGRLEPVTTAEALAATETAMEYRLREGRF